MEPIDITKTFVAKARVLPEEKPGTFEALVSATGVKDVAGDIMEPGCFEKTLAEWVLKSRPIPVVWSHQFNDPFSILGKYLEQEETDNGLRMKGELNLEWAKAAHVHELMKEDLIVEFSISGRVRDYEWIEDDDEDSWWPGMSIKDIDLWEAGPCFKGANPETELLSVKSNGSLGGRIPILRKEGRAISQKNLEKLKSARDQLNEIITATDTTEESTGKTADPDVSLSSESKQSAGQFVTPAVRALLDL